MKDLIKKLQNIIDEPDDLTEIPTIIEGLQEKNADNESNIEKIGKLHELNRKYLSMIPIKDDTEHDEPPEEKTSVDDAVNEIMKGVQ